MKKFLVMLFLMFAFMPNCTFAYYNYPSGNPIINEQRQVANQQRMMEMQRQQLKQQEEMLRIQRQRENARLDAQIRKNGFNSVPMSRY
ncbi:MAG: hypothetical protein NC390_04030 [Fusobacterium sp.]|nr:hypothetical protein [Fusobacterium sp.]